MKIFRSLLALVICLSCLFSMSVCAFAEETDESQLPQIIDPAELEKITKDFIASNGLNEKLFSVGYCYTATGDTWMFNEDKWYYSASTYKVPLMMLLAELEAKGEIDRDTPIKNLPLGEAEELILTHSHNDYAHLMMSYFGTEPDCRDLYKQYSDLPDDYYVDNFREYSYFTAHFLTDVMKTLYFENERFPNIIESLLPAQPGHYFKTYIEGYDIAQKYGALKEYNHTAGIVYTPNPFILVVMTEYCPAPDGVIGGYAELMLDYTLKLDEKLDEYNKQLEEAEKKAAEEAAAEEKRQEELRNQQLDEALKAEEEKLTLEAEAAAQAALEAAMTPEAKEEKNAIGPILIAAAALIVALVVFAFVRTGRKSRRRSRKSQYIPKH